MPKASLKQTAWAKSTSAPKSYSHAISGQHNKLNQADLFFPAISP
jgi:hypothetical protein